MDSEYWEAHFDIYTGLHGKWVQFTKGGVTWQRAVKFLMNFAV